MGKPFFADFCVIIKGNPKYNEECFMNLKFAFTALCCKALSFAAQKLGGGTDRPGSIALIRN